VLADQGRAARDATEGGWSDPTARSSLRSKRICQRARDARIAPLGKSSAGLGLIAAAAFLLDASGLLDELPSSQDRVAELFDGLEAWTYLVAGLLAFLEVGTFVGLFVPSELGVPFAGAAAAHGSISLPTLVIVVWPCAVAGESLNFVLGRALGRGFLIRHGARVRLTEARVESVEDYFDRYGGLTVLLARFGAYVRTLTPFIAGAAGMRYRRFLAWSVTGCGLWAAALAALGYAFFDSIDTVIDLLVAVGFGVAAVIATALLWRLVNHRSRE
jgi:membrane protein DedA with SNARE-associated domain